MDIQPTLADKRVMEVLRKWKLRENQKKKLIGEERDEIGFGRGGKGLEGREVSLGGRRGRGGRGREGLNLHLVDSMLERLLFVQEIRQAKWPRPLQLLRFCCCICV